MKLYAVKTQEGYIRFKEGQLREIVKMNKASVFSSLEETKALRDSIGYGIIVELTLNEKELDL